jgi:hypothetical protein
MEYGFGGGRKTSQQIEIKLLEVLRERQRDWVSASEHDRDSARVRFLTALRAFNKFILDGKLPDDEVGVKHDDHGT